MGDSEQSLQPGDIVDGKYRVDDVLGSGGMAVVWAAYHLRLDERVAIKVLRRECADSPEALARFRREARAAVKIKGEHVARVMDVGSLPDGTPYMVMEYLEGTDLANWLRTSGRLAPQQAAEFLLQAAEALAEAHAIGIVHRDLKPANLFVTRRPDGSSRVKVLDFGISKQAPGLGASTITQGTALVGTPLYMSPEQLQASKQIDQRTDIWGLGVILYELLTGEAPFTGDTMPEVVHQIASEAPIPPRVLRPEIPVGLEAVITRCLAKERDGRFANVADFARALAPFAAEAMRGSGDRIAQIIDGAQRSTQQRAADDTPQTAVRLNLPFWPYATTINGKRALKMGMAASAVLAATTLMWAQRQGAAPPAAELSSEVAPPPPNVLVPAPVAPVPVIAPSPAAEAPAAAVIPRAPAPPAAPAGRARLAHPRAPAAAVPRAPGEPLPQAPAPALQTAPQEAREPAAARDRDASVKAMGDDLRPLLNQPHRPRELEDPFR
jgi:eukaryotic-like serine/threonine-protein kinase